MVVEAIKNRRSVREYKPEPIAEEKIIEIVKAAQFAPTANNNKSVEFVVVKNSEAKKKIFDVVEGDFVKQAPVLVLAAIDTKKSNYPVQDLSVASENIFLQAAELGLGTVWKNLRQDKAEKIKSIVGIPKNFLLINLIPLGFPKSKPSAHPDSDFDRKKIHAEKW